MLAEALRTALFWLFAALSLSLAWSVVGNRRILRAAVALMGVLGCSAAFYALLGFGFLAGIQILVYVGGIVVLLVFLVMLTRTQALLEDEPSPWRHKVGVVAALAFFALNLWALSGLPDAPVQGPALGGDTRAIGRALLDTGPEGYVVPFEVVSVLLLAALVGGIAVARKVENATAVAPAPPGEAAHG